MSPTEVSTSHTIRQGRIPDDVAEILDVTGAYDSEPQSEEEFLRIWTTWDQMEPRLRLVAEVNGKVVATSYCRRRSSFTPGLFMLNLYVHTDCTGQGIGTELVRQSEEFVLAEGGSKILAFASEGIETCRSFAETLGYRHTRTLFESVLTVGDVDGSWVASHLARLNENGIRFTTLAEAGETEQNLRRFFEVQSECDLDEPSMGEIGKMNWEDFERQVLESPWYHPEGAFIATDGSEWAGVHTLGPLDGSDAADMSTDFTGVRRPYRGRGLALALKMQGVNYARSLGRTRILTHNDSTNIAMLAVNKKLGFENQPGWLFMTKEIQPKG